MVIKRYTTIRLTRYPKLGGDLIRNVNAEDFGKAMKILIELGVPPQKAGSLLKKKINEFLRDVKDRDFDASKVHRINLFHKEIGGRNPLKFAELELHIQPALSFYKRQYTNKRNTLY